MTKFKSLLVFLFLAIGIGAEAAHAQPAPKAGTMQTVFENKERQLTGVAVSATGRIFTNYPRWAGPYQNALEEVTSLHQSKPFPDKTWNSWNGSGDKMAHFLCVQAVVIDQEDFMWVVDAGATGTLPQTDKGQKLVQIDLKTNTVLRVYPLAAATDGGSYANDARIDSKNQLAYITNSNQGGIIIVDLKSGDVRQVLNHRRVTLADTSYQMQRHNKPLLQHGKPFRVHSDGIALSPDGKFLFFKALTDDRLFKVATADLNHTALSDDELEARVLCLGNFTTTDGLGMDNLGNLYLGDLEKRQLICLSPDLKVRVIVPPDEALAWPDSYHFTADGWLYISCSRIDEQPQFHNGKNQRQGPYKIVRIKLY
ncbi:L-dopachrome tautomerase-related protein [Sphingobacterium sp. Mn56C]|uniref:L-dopachrome tautomerase-related protein n=1 Tax=Sphingobacterium sp. Mn56C TaxID=3395261 RepID=UPI003BD91DB6